MSPSAGIPARWLVVVEEAFVPADAGGRVESLNLLRAAAAAGVELTVVVPGVLDRPAQDAHRAALPAGTALHFVPRREGAAALLSPQPYVFASRPVPAALVGQLAADHDRTPWDAVVAVSFRSAPTALALARALRLPMLVRSYNIESDYFDALARSSSLPRSLMYRLEAAKLRRAERRLHADPTIVAFAEIGEKDAEARRRHTGRTVLFVPPFVGDRPIVGRPPVDTSTPGSEPVLLFLGSLDFANNIEGIRWFAQRVWPGVRDRTTRAGAPARFRVAGRRASPALVEELEAAGAEVLVDVPDVAPVLAGADVFLNPVLAGAGVNIKMVEAMAASLPVVSTSVGARGLPWRDGEHLLIADEEQAFAAAVSGLLADRASRDRLARAGRRFISEELDGGRQIDRLRAALAADTAR